MPRLAADIWLTKGTELSGNAVAQCCLSELTSAHELEAGIVLLPWTTEHSSLLWLILGLYY
jgi:hypothetical protein